MTRSKTVTGVSRRIMDSSDIKLTDFFSFKGQTASNASTLPRTDDMVDYGAQERSTVKAVANPTKRCSCRLVRDDDEEDASDKVSTVIVSPFEWRRHPLKVVVLLQLSVTSSSSSSSSEVDPVLDACRSCQRPPSDSMRVEGGSRVQSMVTEGSFDVSC